MTTQTKRRRHTLKRYYDGHGDKVYGCAHCLAERGEYYRLGWKLNGKPVPWCEGRNLAQNSR